MWRVAAVAASIGFAAMFAVSPLGAWVAREAGRLIAGKAANRATTLPERSAAARTLAVSFALDTGEVLFWLDVQPAGGVLELRRAEGGRGPTAEVFGGRTGDEIAVLPNGIRVHNDSLSNATYRLIVPGRRIRVRVGVGRNTIDTLLNVSDTGSRLALRPRGGQR